MGLPRALMGFYSFMVLSCIGVGIIVVALLRHMSTQVLLAGSIAVLVLASSLRWRSCHGSPVAVRPYC